MIYSIPLECCFGSCCSLFVAQSTRRSILISTGLFSGFAAQFLEILSMFLTIPSERNKGGQIWNTLLYIVSVATIQNEQQGGSRMTTDELLAMLADKEARDAKVCLLSVFVVCRNL